MTSSLDTRYENERIKREKYVNGFGDYMPATAAGIEDLSADDPWIEQGTPVNDVVLDGGHCKIVVFGAGFSGLVSAIQCLRTGAAKDPSDLLIVDPAGGFGGTWYYNRYPGLMCDHESYQYLPFLEETRYMPRDKYASGQEVREYLELLATHFCLDRRAMFQSSGLSAVWNDDSWYCEISKEPKGLIKKTINIRADFIIMCAGPLTYAKIPDVPGLSSFQGVSMHTSRWRYDITGGSQQQPVMQNLTNKRVAVIGTAATGVQVVPELAKYAGELFVVQRTPSAVDQRLNRRTDPVEWKTQVAKDAGWQIARCENTQLRAESPIDPPEPIADDDGWTLYPSLAALFGMSADISPCQISKYHEKLREDDDRWTNRVRQHTAEVVNDARTAERLQAWYPGWCKVLAFNDEYLPAFNRPNVHLVDTDGKGLEALTPHGFVVNGQEYLVDIIVWATGYGSGAICSPAGFAQMRVVGRNSVCMDTLFDKTELFTLHGIMPRHFPNLFLTGLSQAGFSLCYNLRLLAQGEQVGYTITQAEQRVPTGCQPVVEPTEAACEAWAAEIANNQYRVIGWSKCTPSRFNLYGDAAKVTNEKRLKSSKFGRWGKGFLEYARVLERWRVQGDLEGLVVGYAKTRKCDSANGASVRQANRSQEDDGTSSE